MSKTRLVIRLNGEYYAGYRAKRHIKSFAKNTGQRIDKWDGATLQRVINEANRGQVTPLYRLTYWFFREPRSVRLSRSWYKKVCRKFGLSNKLRTRREREALDRELSTIGTALDVPSQPMAPSTTRAVARRSLAQIIQQGQQELRQTQQILAEAQQGRTQISPLNWNFGSISTPIGGLSGIQLAVPDNPTPDEAPINMLIAERTGPPDDFAPWEEIG